MFPVLNVSSIVQMCIIQSSFLLLWVHNKTIVSEGETNIIVGSETEEKNYCVLKTESNGTLKYYDLFD